MKNLISILVLATLFIVILIGCKTGKPVAKKLEDFKSPELELPKNHSFLMGFTYQPHKWSPEAFEQTAEFISENGDFIIHFLDEGVPWQEAYDKTKYSKLVEEDFTRRLKLLKPNQKVVLAVGAMKSDRRTLNGIIRV